MVEDETGIVGYALAVLDARSYYSKLGVAWIPEMLKKYPIPSDQSQGQHSKYIQILNELHNDRSRIYTDPEVIFKNHPSLLNISTMTFIPDLSVSKRMLACVIAALKANGTVLRNLV